MRSAFAPNSTFERTHITSTDAVFFCNLNVWPIVGPYFHYFPVSNLKIFFLCAGDMFPAPAFSVVDAARGNAKFSCNLNNWSGIVSYVDYCIFSQEGIGLFRSTKKVAASFLNHILSVIQGRPQKKMIGIYAWWVIARVANEHAFRDWSPVEFIRKMVCFFYFAIYPKGAILPWVLPLLTSYPYPATVVISF